MLARRKVRAYIATGKQRHDRAKIVGRGKQARTQAMRRRLARGGYRSRYRLRKQTVEPVFGQIKQARGFRQFLLRGSDKTSGEWSLICTVHNLLKSSPRDVPAGTSHHDSARPPNIKSQMSHLTFNSSLRSGQITVTRTGS